MLICCGNENVKEIIKYSHSGWNGLYCSPYGCQWRIMPKPPKINPKKLKNEKYKNSWHLGINKPDNCNKVLIRIKKTDDLYEYKVAITENGKWDDIWFYLGVCFEWMEIPE